MSRSRSTVALYGPRPEAAHRTGGVAKWMEYLEEICDTAGIDSRSLYVDRLGVDRLSIPAVLKRGLGSLACVRDLFRLAGQGEVLVHVNASLYPTTVLRDWPLVATAVARGCPVFLQVHGGRLCNLQSGSIPCYAWHWMCRKAAVLGIHPGPQWREFIKYGYEDKLRRMYNLVPRSGWTADLGTTTAHFLYLGRLTEKKGVEEALDKVFRFRDEGYHNVKMTIAGDGPLLEHLRAKVASSDHKDSISVEGFVEGQALDEVRKRANIFVLPSRHQEGFPFSYLECAERGMACIVTDNSAIREVFDPGVEFEPVDLSEPGDLYAKMKRMVTDVGHRERIGRAGQKAVRSCCTIQSAAWEFGRLYTTLAKEHA